VSTGTRCTSSSFAQAASLYGLIVGLSSVSASLKRTNAFMWLSGTWWTTWRTVHPPSRYGVFSCASVRPRTAARSAAGVSRIAAIEARRISGVTSGLKVKGPVGKRGSVLPGEVMHAC
jgi:hypothetical protein